MYVVLLPHPDPTCGEWYAATPYPVPIGLAETIARRIRAEFGRTRARVRIVPA